MKKLLVVIATTLCFAIAAPVFAAEVYFNPGTQHYNMDGSSTLFLWSVPEANGQALIANPDYGWPTETSVAVWYATILKAQEMSLRVVIGYDPVSFEIWYVTNPRP